MIHVTIESKESLEKVQKLFKEQLSEKQILKTTAFAINETARRSRDLIKKDIKSTYTINKKYLERLAYIKPASGTVSGLYAEVHLSHRPTPMIGFTYQQQGKRGGVTVEIKRGKSVLLKRAFVRTMRSGHAGIFMTGRYIANKFMPVYERTPNRKTRITELKTGSPFGMGSSPEMQRKVQSYVIEHLPKRTSALLQQKIK